MSSFLTPGVPRTSKTRISSLPTYSSAVYEKSHLSNGNGHLLSGTGASGGGLFTTFYISIPLPSPANGPRRAPLVLPLPLPIPPRMYAHATARFGRRRGWAVLLLAAIATLWMVFALAKRFGTHEKKWPTPFQSDSTLVFQRADLRQVWDWEIRSGHYPSSRKRERAYFYRLACFSISVLTKKKSSCSFTLAWAMMWCSPRTDWNDSGSGKPGAAADKTA